MTRNRRRSIPASEALTRPAPDVLEDGVPATEELPGELLRTGEASEGPLPPGDRLLASDEWGTTSAEERRGEPLDRRIAREEPDALVRVDECVGHLYQPAAEYWNDEESTEVGDVDALSEDTCSAEEQAIHIVNEPPGITYDGSPDYLDEGRREAIPQRGVSHERH
jgi:hypothetical protein